MHLVAFDIDGTLVDSGAFESRLYVQSVQEVLRVRIDDDWTRYRDVSDSGILEQILDEAHVENREHLRAAVKSTFIRLMTEYLNARGGVLPEIAGARKFFVAVAEHPGVVVAIATGCWTETAMLKLRAIGLGLERVGFASSSDAVRRADIMRLAEQRALLGRPARRRTYFGDGPWDKAASEQLGYEFVAIGGRVPHEPAYADFSCAEKILAELGLRA